MTAGAEPSHGGALRLYGNDDLDHLDPSCASRASATQLIRLFHRQLFTYEPMADLRQWRAIEPVPDIATAVPSMYNAGVGASHLTYVVHLRPGVLWDTTPPRVVTTADVIRGVKRLCNPVSRPAALPYFTSTIRGLAEFCDGYASAFSDTHPSAALLAEYQNEHDIPGVFALDDETLVFELVRPALDFVNILALPCASPVPAEYDDLVPGEADFPRHVVSNGPYRVSRHVRGREIRLAPNPSWQPDSDPVGRQHVPEITVTSAAVSRRQVAEAVRAGDADLPWGTRITTDEADGSPRAEHLGDVLRSCLAFNVVSPNAGGALARRDIRMAACYAIDKAALAKLYASEDSASAYRAAHSLIPEGHDAHQELTPFPALNGRGDPERSGQLLAIGGYPRGLTLTMVYRDSDVDPVVARSCADNLREAGITVRLEGLAPAEYHAMLADPRNARSGRWDITLLSLVPEWYHQNARVFVQSPLQSGPKRGLGNVGQYHNPRVDQLIQRALDMAADPTESRSAWQEAERVALDDAALLPLVAETPAARTLVGDSVRGAMAIPAWDYTVSLSQLWLADTVPPVGEPVEAVAARMSP
ncbi:ABC transporter substrate-binding protein [Haloechinothrix salitolerans]|uniref:ABC transporter substrate-binding protein n=1 Tax=Haloechinothrix salitolerans TaxID=926830 RepID=A0ABW2BW45_9PSEU